MTRTALILGANGRFGSAMAEALWQAGWRVILFDRSKDSLPDKASGVDVIVNGWNPTYDRWAEELPAQTQQVIDAAKASSARVLFPGNLYVYGADAPPEMSASTPHLASNPLGRIRIDIEAAYRTSGIKLLILRAGDFIDIEASGNWYDRIITKPLAKGVISYPGDLEAPHAWAFLPDLARAGVALLEADLGHQEDILFPGYTLSGEALAAALGEALDRPIRARKMAWWPLRLIAPFVPYMKGVLEMRYLWSMPHRIDPTAFDARLPTFTHTPVAQALAQTAPVRALANGDRPTQDHGTTPLPPQSRVQAT